MEDLDGEFVDGWAYAFVCGDGGVAGVCDP